MKKIIGKNYPGNQKTIMIALVCVAIILIVLVAIDLFKKPQAQAPASSQPLAEEEVKPVEYTDVVAMPAEQKDAFKADVPADMVVPEVGAKLSEEEKKVVAVPTVVVPVAPGASSKFRNFAIKAEAGAFTPSKVIANVGDTVHVDFTAVDADYDIVFPSYNMMQTAVKGQTKMLEFQALESGSFTYYCSACGGPDKGPKGNIIIVP